MGWQRIKDRLRAPKPEADVPSAPVVERPLSITPPIRRREPVSGDTERRLAELRRRRTAFLFDIEQGRLAQQPTNPWTERIALLTDTLAIVQGDLAALDARPVSVRPPVEPLPIESIEAQISGGDEHYAVAFSISTEQFRFEELADWDERGGPRVRGDLQHVTGSIDPLLSAALPHSDQATRDALADHLRQSIAVFATDLRDRALANDPLPTNATLSDLAQPCPTCGGWRAWGGRCPACAARDLERQTLRAEFNRLDEERQREAAERHRLAEGLSISQRRLDAVESDIRALGGDLD